MARIKHAVFKAGCRLAIADMDCTVIAGFFETLDLGGGVQKFVSVEVEISKFVRLLLQQLSDAAVLVDDG